MRWTFRVLAALVFCADAAVHLAGLSRAIGLPVRLALWIPTLALTFLGLRHASLSHSPRWMTFVAIALAVYVTALAVMAPGAARGVELFRADLSFDQTMFASAGMCLFAWGALTLFFGQLPRYVEKP